MVRKATASALGAAAFVEEPSQVSQSPLDCAMDRYAAGDDAAFAELYDALAPRLYGYLLRQTRDRARAEDLVQQTFLQMHAARGRFLRGAEVVPWAFSIARRLLIDGVRRKGREVSLEAQEDEGKQHHSTTERQDDAVHAKDLARAVERELSRLPEGQRAAFELVKAEGLSMAEAAAVLGTTVGAVKLRAHRTYELLRSSLGEMFERSSR